MRYFNGFLLAVLCFSFSSTYANPTSEASSGSPFDIFPFDAPSSKGVDLANYRNQWNRLTGFEYSGLHWKQFIVVYSNIGKSVFRHNYITYLNQIEAEEEEEDFEGAFKKYAVGSVLIKENYGSDHGKPGDPQTLTIMIKRTPGYDADFGDWEYLQSNVKGKFLVQGNSQNFVVKKTCLECHANVAERDYIFSSFYSESK